MDDPLYFSKESTLTSIALSGWRHIELVVDRSASMVPIKAATERGLRAFLAEQSHSDGLITVSLTQFDHEVELLYANCKLTQVPDFTLTPRGDTALLDAIGHTIARTRRFVRSVPKAYRPEEIITVVLTDGQENDSRAFDESSVRALIDEQRSKKRPWRFILLGADETIHALARRLSIDAQTVIQYDHDRSEAVLASASQMISRATRSGDYSFTEAERTATRH
ncbi:vWA domain-containing protein [Nonomuraea sp. NPDC046802]|uniref:vWA domain-containing protein n=1 Tax=Nonomuraea sp. NPDC046802 TaxID=3154919 RepID=UPI0033EE9D91